MALRHRDPFGQRVDAHRDAVVGSSLADIESVVEHPSGLQNTTSWLQGGRTKFERKLEPTSSGKVRRFASPRPLGIDTFAGRWRPSAPLFRICRSNTDREAGAICRARSASYRVDSSIDPAHRGGIGDEPTDLMAPIATTHAAASRPPAPQLRRPCGADQIRASLWLEAKRISWSQGPFASGHGTSTSERTTPRRNCPGRSNRDSSAETAARDSGPQRRATGLSLRAADRPAPPQIRADAEADSRASRPETAQIKE